MLDLLFPSVASIISITVLGILFGLFLSFAKQKLKVERDPRIEQILDALPGANCGACGLPGCSAYATGIVTQKYGIDLCPVGGSASMEKIAGIMDVEASGGNSPVKARLHCQGGITETVRRFIYNGPRDCEAADGIMGGFKVCEYGCLGFGDCERSCHFDAITMGEKGLPVIDIEKCVGCGKCVLACPRNIISLVPEKFDVYVMCMNREKAPMMKKGCSVGCIGCKICEKACREVQEKKHKDSGPADIVPAITVESFCASIDYDLCINCYRCVVECPVPVIDPVGKSKKIRSSQKEEEEKTTQDEAAAVS